MSLSLVFEYASRARPQHRTERNLLNTLTDAKVQAIRTLLTTNMELWDVELLPLAESSRARASLLGLKLPEQSCGRKGLAPKIPQRHFGEPLKLKLLEAKPRS